jgi:hypothetical protein
MRTTLSSPQNGFLQVRPRDAPRLQVRPRDAPRLSRGQTASAFVRPGSPVGGTAPTLWRDTGETHAAGDSGARLKPHRKLAGTRMALGRRTAISTDAPDIFRLDTVGAVSSYPLERRVCGPGPGQLGRASPVGGAAAVYGGAFHVVPDQDDHAFSINRQFHENDSKGSCVSVDAPLCFRLPGVPVQRHALAGERYTHTQQSRSWATPFGMPEAYMAAPDQAPEAMREPLLIERWRHVRGEQGEWGEKHWQEAARIVSGPFARPLTAGEEPSYWIHAPPPGTAPSAAGAGGAAGGGAGPAASGRERRGEAAAAAPPATGRTGRAESPPMLLEPFSPVCMGGTGSPVRMGGAGSPVRMSPTGREAGAAAAAAAAAATAARGSPLARGMLTPSPVRGGLRGPGPAAVVVAAAAAAAAAASSSSPMSGERGGGNRRVGVSPAGRAAVEMRRRRPGRFAGGMRDKHLTYQAEPAGVGASKGQAGFYRPVVTKAPLLVPKPRRMDLGASVASGGMAHKFQQPQGKFLHAPAAALVNTAAPMRAWA